MRNIKNSNKYFKLVSLVGIATGVWGILVVLAFAFSQIRMISPAPPLDFVIDLGLIYLGLHLIVFVVTIIISLFRLNNRPTGIKRPRLLVVTAILLIVSNLIPSSSTGIFMLPATTGMLISNLLFVLHSRSAIHHAA